MMRITRQILFVLKYAICGAILVGFLMFVLFNLFSSIVPGALSSSFANSETEILSFSRDTSEIVRSGTNLPVMWIGIYIGLLIGWALGWHRLKEKKSKVVWRVYRKKR
jgi:hypothetical protein